MEKSLCKQNCCFLMDKNRCDVIKGKDTSAVKECVYYESRDDYEDEELYDEEYDMCSECYSEFPLSCLNVCNSCGITVCEECLRDGLCSSCDEEEYEDEEDYDE